MTVATQSRALLSCEMEEDDEGAAAALSPHVSSRDTPTNGTFVKRFFGVGPQSPDYPKSDLLYPLAPFSLGWLMCTAFFLVYTAIVT